MNPAAKGVRHWLIPLLIFALGTGGSWSLSQAFRQDALRAWRAQTEQTAHALSGTLLGWLEESYAPLSGLGMLAENSTTLTEVEFLNGVDALESRATAFFLDSVAYLHLDTHNELQLIFSTDVSGPLAFGLPSTELGELIPTANAAYDQPGRILLGPPFKLEAGITVSTVALSIVEPSGRASIMLGLINLDALIGGLFEQLVPTGLTLRVNGKFLGSDSVPVYTDTSDATLHTVTTRTISAGADLSISWNASAKFKGGVADKLANLTFLTGTLFSVIIALFIGMLLRRDQVISQKIQEATLELEHSKDAADEANLAKSEFLANMSHELRTPMNAILGYSEMLMEEAEDADQKDFIPDLKKINQAGTHLLSLINDVLDLSKIEAGKMEAFPEEIILDSLIDEVSATIHPQLVKNGNKLAVERGRNLGSAFQDLTKLRQVLLNLMSNAAKFTHDGTVTLHANRLSRENGDWLTLAVSDTGIGIEDDMLEQIFDEFIQADNSTTRDYGGTGLGLTIARRFCKLLGGDLDAYSDPGLGSTFTVRIPADLPDLEGAQQTTVTLTEITETEPESAQDISAGSSILVIDDDPEACELIERNLTKDGFRVVTTTSGEQGLRLAHEIQPAAITLDVMMPDMDGWSVLRALKADPRLHHIPVIMLTMMDDQSRGYSLGAVDYLTKPIDRKQLHKTLNRYYRGSESGTVMLVEDDLKTRDMMARTLEKADWNVSEAGNGQEALELLAVKAPDLILLDLMMPVMDGFGFLAEMRVRPELQHIPVIVVTAKDLTANDRQRLSGQVEQVLDKSPYTREQLLEYVRDAVTACSATRAANTEEESPSEQDTAG